MITTQVGAQGFLWFFGKVVDIDDPAQIGRVKVFIFNEHYEGLDQEDFRWAIPILPVTSPSAVFGSTPSGSTMNLVVGSMVFGFFADGAEKQQPMILGSFHTAPNYPSLAGISIPEQAYTKKIKPPITGNDPADTADPQYPFNNVYTSPAGHVVEIDNTPGSQRVAVHHNSGSYVEIDNDGDIVIGSTNAARYSSSKQTEITAKGNVNIASDQGNILLAARNVINIKSDKHIVIDTPSNVTITARAGVKINGDLTVTGTLQSISAASGVFTSPVGQSVYVSSGIVTDIVG